MSTDNYDFLPCANRPFSATRPENLYLISALFGFAAVDFRCARVLELGCASGGNIIPLADSFPDCTFVGVDDSQALLSEGERHIRNLSLTNITLEYKSLEEIDESFGEFDYIIVHGIYSWVAEDKQKKIIEVCKKNLSKQGIALVSYNTNPGWNVCNSFKDMMLYHTQSIPDMYDKARQGAKRASSGNVVVNPGESWASLVTQECQENYGYQGGYDIDDYYLLHDHIEQHNCPQFVQEFSDNLTASGLQYVSDLDFMKYSPYLLPPDGREVIFGIKDRMQAEQYMDYIYHRRFRQTLICHSGFETTERITTRLLDRTKISSKLRLKGVVTFQQLTNKEVISFEYKNYKITTKDPIVKVALHLLECAEEPLDWKVLVNEVANQNLSASAEEIITTLSNINYDQLLAYEVIEFSAKDTLKTHYIDVNPCASRFSRYQSNFTDGITNLHHQVVSLDSLGRTLLGFLDGSNTVSEALRKLRISIEESGQKHFELGYEGGHKRIDKKIILDNFDELARHYIAKLAEQDLIH